MFKVNISNQSQNLSWSAKFPTEQEAQSWLNKQIGKPHRLPERVVSIESEYDQADVLEVIQEEVNGQLQDVSVRLKAQFISEIVDISAEVAQQNINQESLKFLNETDFMVLRHIRQKALNQSLSLTEEEYLALEQQRATAANSIVR